MCVPLPRSQISALALKDPCHQVAKFFKKLSDLVIGVLAQDIPNPLILTRPFNNSLAIIISLFISLDLGYILGLFINILSNTIHSEIQRYLP